MESRERIFVVDNEQIDCLIAKVLLEKASPYRVESYFSVQTALDALTCSIHNRHENLPRIIFLDLDMPLKGGWDLLAQYQSLIKDTTLKLPFIYIITCSMTL